jgi:hypothetical protein
MKTFDIKPEILRWAVERARLKNDEINSSIFKDYNKWLSGSKKPTLSQLEKFCKRTYLPFSYLFLNKPINEKLSIPDFRTLNSVEIINPSINLIETYDHCVQCQEWYKNQLVNVENPLKIKHFTTSDNVNLVSGYIREVLNLEITELKMQSWEKRKHIINELEKNGIITILSGYVGTNNHRTLDLDELRGFSLYDE